MSETKVKDYVVDGKNKEVVKCKHCGSKILEEKAATYVTQELDLPLMLQATGVAAAEVQSEPLLEFWCVPDMYTFENIGFTHSVASRKYLSCADCEVGPIGFHDLTTKQSYVALARVA